MLRACGAYLSKIFFTRITVPGCSIEVSIKLRKMVSSLAGGLLDTHMPSGNVLENHRIWIASHNSHVMFLQEISQLFTMFGSLVA